MPLVIYGLEGEHTRAHTHTHTNCGRIKVISRNQARTGCWYKNFPGSLARCKKVHDENERQK